MMACMANPPQSSPTICDPKELSFCDIYTNDEK